MKCLHCEGRIDRDAWFCPHCKRSVKEARQVHRDRRLLALLGGACAASAVAGAVLALRALPPRVPSSAARPADAASVTIAEAPVVRISPRTEEVSAVTPPVPEPTAPVPIRMGAGAGDLLEPVETPQPFLAARAPEPAEELGTGSLTVTTDRAARTFVYLDGGKLLGVAPLRNAAVPAGRHTLVFWAPSIQGRASRTIHVPRGGSIVVTEEIRQQSTFTEGATDGAG
ncbi:MAG: hypothetical protein ACK47B_09045 [Armatimonadota bacterium]